MAISGDSGVLQFSPDNSTYSAVAELTSWSIDIAADTIETTSMGDTIRYKSFIGGKYSWSGSCEANWVDDDVAQEAVESAVGDGPDPTFYGKFYPGGASGVDYWSGLILVTSISYSGSIGAAVSCSISFPGNGAITRVNA